MHATIPCPHFTTVSMLCCGIAYLIFLFQVRVVHSDSEHDKQDLASSQKASKTKNPFAKKRRGISTLEREKVKAAKNEREKKMKEDKKKKMAGMDEKKYAEKELEDEILVSYKTLLYKLCHNMSRCNTFFNIHS